MKRLLCIISNMNTGGAETFLMKIYRAIDKTQYQMDFCTNGNGDCFYKDEIEKLGGKIYCIPPKSQSVKDFKKNLKEVIEKNNYKYVIRVTSNAMGFMDLKIAKEAGAEVCIVRSSNSSDGGGLKAFLAHRLGKLLYEKYVDVKIAPSDLAAEYTFGKKAYRDGNVHILHNAVDTKVYRFDKQLRENIRKEFKISDETKVIGHIGRFMAQKNHTFLLDVFSEIHKRMPGTVLMLVGGGELEGQIRAKVSNLGIDDAVIFTGVRSDIPALLSAMDVFVFPSLYEGMPNTVIEAQATGLPCVISDTITKEADITGLVKYLPLDCSVEKWASAVFEEMKNERKDTHGDFVEAGYDICKVAKEFVSVVFGEKGN